MTMAIENSMQYGNVSRFHAHVPNYFVDDSDNLNTFREDDFNNVEGLVAEIRCLSKRKQFKDNPTWSILGEWVEAIENHRRLFIPLGKVKNADLTRASGLWMCDFMSSRDCSKTWKECVDEFLSTYQEKINPSSKGVCGLTNADYLKNVLAMTDEAVRRGEVLPIGSKVKK